MSPLTQGDTVFQNGVRTTHLSAYVKALKRKRCQRQQPEAVPHCGSCQLYAPDCIRITSVAISALPSDVAMNSAGHAPPKAGNGR